MEITIKKRYSETEKSDKHGRWARDFFIKSAKIGTICRVNDNKDDFKFIVTLYFPKIYNKVGINNDCEVFNNFEDSKNYIKDSFQSFIEYVK